MTRLQATGWAFLSLAVGGGLLGYLVAKVSPYVTPGQPNFLLIGLFLGAILLAMSGVISALALLLHQRFPALGGGNQTRLPLPGVALRQGFLIGCAVVAMLVLAFFQLIDIVFVLAIFLLVGLIEAYWQRSGRR